MSFCGERMPAGVLGDAGECGQAACVTGLEHPWFRMSSQAEARAANHGGRTSVTALSGR
jgi:hypothetical protein